MKKLLAPILLIFLAACTQKPAQLQNYNTDTTIVAKTDTAVNVADTPTAFADTSTITDPIIFIRQKVEGINTTQLEKKHHEFMCDEKMMVDYFYRNGELVKISIDFGTVGDVYAKEDYYYDAGKLIFKYEFVEGGPACDNCIKKNEYRSYIKNNKVIKYLKDKSATSCRTCEFSASSKENKLLKTITTAEVKKVLCR